MQPVVLAALIVAGTALAITAIVLGRSRHPAQSRPTDSLQRRLDGATREALAAVDLLAASDQQLTAPKMSAVSERLRFVSEHLAGLDANSLRPGVEDAVDDLRHVSISLSAALDAEHSLRHDESAAATGDAVAARRRVVERTLELDTAARDLITLTSPSP